MTTPELPVVKIVGLSAAGKTTLVNGLRQLGYNARPASQEHSNVPTMWLQLHPPVLLIYLYVDARTQVSRRPDLTWREGGWSEELRRLAHAHAHARLWIDTSDLTPHQVRQLTLTYLRKAGIGHNPTPLPPAPATGSALEKDPR